MESLILKIKDFEKTRLLDIKRKYQEKEYTDIIDYLLENYDKIIYKNIFDIEKDKNIINFNLLQGKELYKIKAGLHVNSRYREILRLNKKNIY